MSMQRLNSRCFRNENNLQRRMVEKTRNDMRKTDLRKCFGQLNSTKWNGSRMWEGSRPPEFNLRPRDRNPSSKEPNSIILQSSIWTSNFISLDWTCSCCDHKTKVWKYNCLRLSHENKNRNLTWDWIVEVAKTVSCFHFSVSPKTQICACFYLVLTISPHCAGNLQTCCLFKPSRVKY